MRCPLQDRGRCEEDLLPERVVTSACLARERRYDTYVGSGDDEPKQPIGGLVGGVAGLLVSVFDTIGRVVLTLLVGSRIASETENRRVVTGGVLCGETIAITMGLFGDSDRSIWLFPAIVFGSGGGAVVGWFALNVLREPWD